MFTALHSAEFFLNEQQIFGFILIMWSIHMQQMCIKTPLDHLVVVYLDTFQRVKENNLILKATEMLMQCDQTPHKIPVQCGQTLLIQFWSLFDRLNERSSGEIST